MTCSLTRLPWLLVFTPCFFNFEWGNACNWYLAIGCIHQWLEAFRCARQMGDSAKVNGCCEDQCPCSVFRTIWFPELVCGSDMEELVFFCIRLLSMNLLPVYQPLPFLHFSGQSFLSQKLLWETLWSSHFLWKQLYFSLVIEVSLVLLQVFSYQ